MLLWVISTLLSLSHYSVFQQQDLIYHVPLLKKERKLLINMWKALWGTLGIREENLNFLKFFFFFFFFNVDHFLSPYCIYFWFYYCFFGCKLCRILALQLGIEPDPPALEIKPQPSHYQEFQWRETLECGFIQLSLQIHGRLVPESHEYQNAWMLKFFK